MAAKIVTVSPDVIWEPVGVQRLWFFPDGSEYLRYAPHFHLIYDGGFRQNMPLVYMFFVIMEGKLSIKSYWGNTNERIDVRDQVWFYRGTNRLAKRAYAMMLPGNQPLQKMRKKAREVAQKKY